MMAGEQIFAWSYVEAPVRSVDLVRTILGGDCGAGVGASREIVGGEHRVLIAIRDDTGLTLMASLALPELDGLADAMADEVRAINLDTADG